MPLGDDDFGAHRDHIGVIQFGTVGLENLLPTVGLGAVGGLGDVPEGIAFLDDVGSAGLDGGSRSGRGGRAGCRMS